MNAALRAPPNDVPTLTEVVRPSELAATVELVSPTADINANGNADADVDVDHLARQITGALQGRMDALLQVRLREQLPPLLERLVSQLVGELARACRDEMSAELLDAVRQAVAEELARSHLR